MSTSPAHRWLLAALAVAAVGAGGLLFGEQGPTPGPVGMTLAAALSFTPLGWFVLRRMPEHPLGRLMAVTGVCAAMAVLAVCWSALPVVAWLSQWLWWPPLPLIGLMLLIFPDGRLPRRGGRPLAGLLVGSGLLTTLALAAAAVMAPQTLVSTVGQAMAPSARALVQVALLGVAGFVVAAAAVLATLVVRWRRASALERHQLACLAPAGGLLVVGVVLAVAGVPGGWLPAVVALPLGFTLAVVQFQLFNLDLYIHRGLVWLLLIAVTVLVFAATLTALDRLLGEDRSETTTLLAGAAAATALLPAERFAQRAVSRLLYGRRDDAYGVLMQVGRHIEDIRDPMAVLPRFAATLVETLRVPYAAISLAGHADSDDGPLIIETGRRTGVEPERFPMVTHGVLIGELQVEARRPGARFSSAETHLLRGLALQAGVAAEACRSTLELQRARERLVLAREEERRRLRRDLHDGVASALVGARMLASAAQSAAPADSKAPALLETLGHELTVCTEEVRDLIDGLRPAVLDAGLADALQQAVRRLPDSLSVDLEIDGDLDQLPAALEVVTLRVVTEALTNVVKHAAASRAYVRVVSEADVLTLEVSDNGTGLAGPGSAGSGSAGSTGGAGADGRFGVGLTSIRSRVEEVGGRLTIEDAGPGLRCRAVLPVRSHLPSELGSDSSGRTAQLRTTE